MRCGARASRVLVARLGGRGTQWEPFIEPLVSAGMTAVAIDAPRHGESAAPRTSLLHFAAALTAVVASVGPPRAVIGHSLGGAASAFAMRGGLDSERLVLIGAPYDPSRFLRAFAGNLGVSARLHDAMLRSVEENFGFHWSDVLVTAPHERPEVPVLVVHDRDESRGPLRRSRTCRGRVSSRRGDDDQRARPSPHFA